MSDNETTSNRPKGKVWLVTGASSGFGEAIAEAALDAGDTVIATARQTNALKSLVERYPDRAIALELDVTDSGRTVDIVADAIAKVGRIDVLVNNAGRGLVGAVEETTDRELRDLMDLHFFGPAALTRAVLPHMRHQKSGAIVQVTSQGGRFSFPGVSAYCATKFALEGFSEALAAEVASFGITVMIVEPGAFRTGFAGAGALQLSQANPAYADIVGPVRAGLPESHGHQPGDPAKAAGAILRALSSEPVPLRLVLGTDAADAVSAHLDRSRAEFLAWEAVTRSTDCDTAPHRPR